MIVAMSLTRRDALKSLAAAPAFLRGQGARRPNVLFCISDDQSWIHAGAHGSRFVRTPAFDRVAQEGVLFNNAFVSTPSCAPSRASVLTGQDFYRLGPASMNHTEWQRGAETYPELLAAAGYHTGYTFKGWAPGNWRKAGRTQTPCGPDYSQVQLKAPGSGISPCDYDGNFAAFLERRPKDAPFCFWAGFSEPHRVFDDGIGLRHGKRLEDITVPGFLPDSPEVRSDLADYAFEIEWFDRHLGRMLDRLAKLGELDNTIVVVTADNGMAFPRAKGNLYEYGAHMPLALRWGARVKPGWTSDQFVSFADFAPTFLEAAGLPVPRTATGRSLLAHLDRRSPHRSHAVFGIERHFPGSRPSGAGYPSRAVRTSDLLYIRNLTPDRNPVGDNPGPAWPEDDPTGGYGDTDGSPTKTFLFRNRARHAQLFDLAFGKRPAEELYDIANDPFNLTNLAADPRWSAKLQHARTLLENHRRQTADPRALSRGAELDAVMRQYPSLSMEVNRREAGRK